MNETSKSNPIHPYVRHLLDDIKAAHRDGNSYDLDETPESIEEEFEEIERWVAGEFDNHDFTFGYYYGLDAADFPPPEQLSERDIELVCNAFRKLLFSWQSYINLPENLPLRIRYKFMVGTLNEGFTPVNSGFLGFDYCTGYAPYCPFGEYCSCLEF